MRNRPKVMRGIQLIGHGGLDKLVFRDDIPVPIPRPRDVLIKVGAAGVNNTDLNTRIGWYSKSNGEGSDASWSGTAIQFPRIQGADVCDKIVAIGDQADNNLLNDLEGDLFEIRAEFEIGTASEFGFRIQGDHTVSYDVNTNQASMSGELTTSSSWEMQAVNNRVQMQILVDRSIIEAFYDQGRAWLISTFFAGESEQALEIFSTGGDTRLVSLDIFELKSAWDRQTP